MALILVVDDAAFMRARCARLLIEQGYEVVEAANGEDALQVYAAEHPDAVLMDVTMPEMNGLEALAALLQDDPTARVAMVTAIGQQATILDALQKGALDFVVKPFTPERLLDAVGKLLAA